MHTDVIIALDIAIERQRGGAAIADGANAWLINRNDGRIDALIDGNCAIEGRRLDAIFGGIDCTIDRDAGGTARDAAIGDNTVAAGRDGCSHTMRYGDCAGIRASSRVGGGDAIASCRVDIAAISGNIAAARAVDEDAVYARNRAGRINRDCARTGVRRADARTGITRDAAEGGDAIRRAGVAGEQDAASRAGDARGGLLGNRGAARTRLRDIKADAVVANNVARNIDPRATGAIVGSDNAGTRCGNNRAQGVNLDIATICDIQIKANSSADNYR